jgi:hypothetical protein
MAPGRPARHRHTARREAVKDPTNFRMDRIQRLLQELRYEVERGMLEREIDEDIGYRFIVPISRKINDGVVHCEFRTRPMPRSAMSIDDLQPRLRVVQGEKPG